MTKAAEIRSGLSHPIIDADGHFVEVAPLLNEEMLTYLEEMGAVSYTHLTLPTNREV